MTTRSSESLSPQEHSEPRHRAAGPDLEAAARRLAAIVESSGDAILGKTLDGTITDWNPAAERLYGFSSDEVLGKSISLIVPPDRRRELDRILAKLRRGERIDSFETVRTARDGRRIDVSLTISPILDGNGTVIGASAIARDVTERNRIQAALQASEERFRRQFEAVPLATYIWRRVGDDFVLEQYNDEAQRITEGRIRTSIGSLASRFFHDEPDVLVDLHSCLATGATIRRESPYRMRTTGRAHHLVIHYVPVPPDAVMIQTEDITARVEGERERADLLSRERTARAEAEAALRARDEFLSIASHELRTPVTTIKGFVQVLLRARARGEIEPDRLERALERVDQASDRLAALIQDLLDVSRMRLGKLPLSARRVDLCALVREAVAAFQHSGEGDVRNLELELPAAALEVVADPARLEQVLTNILDNASKYSPDGGSIRVRLAEDAGGVLLTVSDQGIGLPAGSEEAIFEPFGRAANAATRHIPGMGLGLHICRDIVHRHDGRMWAESAGEDRGSTLFVWLPYGGVPADSAASEPDA